MEENRKNDKKINAHVSKDKKTVWNVNAKINGA